MVPVVARTEPRSRCWSCGWKIDPEDRYCRQCGRGQGASIPWYYRPLAIALLALTVLGPFALPLVWRTPHLGRGAKWVASLVLVALTVYVGWRLAAALSALGDVLAGV